MVRVGGSCGEACDGNEIICLINLQVDLTVTLNENILGRVSSSSNCPSVFGYYMTCHDVYVTQRDISYSIIYRRHVT